MWYHQCSALGKVDKEAFYVLLILSFPCSSKSSFFPSCSTTVHRTSLTLLCLKLFQSLLCSFKHTDTAFASAWMMPQQDGHPDLAGRPPAAQEGPWSSGVSHLIPPIWLHRGFQSASSSFLALQTHFAFISLFNVIPRNTFIFYLVLLRFTTIPSYTR